MTDADAHDDERAESDPSVVSTVDRSTPRTRFVVTDVSADDEWVSVPRAEAPVLARWR